MRNRLLEDLEARCAGARRPGPVQDRAGHRLAAVGPHPPRRRLVGAQPLRQQLPRPRRPPRPRRGRAPGARPLRLRHGLGAVHLRHPDGAQGAGGRARRRSSAPTTRSSTRRASTPTAGCSRRSSTSRTRSSPTRSTTPRSSTASGCARPDACATTTTTWPSSSSACRRRPTPATG